MSELLFSIWITFACYTSVIGLSLFFMAIVMWVSSFVILYSWRKSHLQNYPYLPDGSICNKIMWDSDYGVICEVIRRSDIMIQVLSFYAPTKLYITLQKVSKFCDSYNNYYDVMLASGEYDFTQNQVLCKIFKLVFNANFARTHTSCAS